MQTFGQTLKRLRSERQLTQEELAEAAGIGRVTLARLETDKAVATWPTVRALAKALGISCQVFENGGGPAAATPGKPQKRR
jgi:transcriptional regulator with XRE-family HTH domain